jgi:hypothetical protein
LNAVFISGSVPFDTYGSPIIFLRHLRRLEEQGCKITIVTREKWVDRFQFSPTWKKIGVPCRRAWWPPVREKVALSGTFRWIQQAKWLKNRLRKEGIKPDFIVTYLWDSLAFVSGWLGRMLNVPVVSFVHDNMLKNSGGVQRDGHRYLGANKWMERFASQACKFFTVTERLAYELGLPQEKIIALPPIPDGTRLVASGQDVGSNEIVIGLSGTFYPGLEKVIEKIGSALKKIPGKLIVVGNVPSTTLPIDSNSVTFVPRFPTAAEALRFLKQNCNVLLIAHPELSDSTEMLRSSFPSKLIEYSHLGMPVLLITDNETSFADWSRNVNLPFVTPSDSVGIENAIRNLQDPVYRKSIQTQIEQLSMSVFDPEFIHRCFFDEICKALAQKKGPRK